MLAIWAPRLFDGERFITGGATVLTDAGRIVGVESGFREVGGEWQVLEFSDATVLPGLIDTHVHLAADSGFGALDRIAGFSDDEMDAVISDGLRRQLASGVTTVRDLGDRRFGVLERRDRQRAGGATEPESTILAAGPPLTSPGGHCASMGGEVRGVPAMVDAVHERIDRGVDVVKIMASGGMNTTGTDILQPQFSIEELTAAADLAHGAGIGLSVHAHALAAVEQALDVGAECIEHCSCLTDKGQLLTDEMLDRLASSGVAIGAALGMPPVAVMMDHVPPNVLAMMEKTGMTPEMVIERRMTTMARMYRAGVRLVTGNDSGIAPWLAHGLMRGSAETMVAFGASTAEAVAASTSVAAQACAVGDRKGFLRKGYDADVIVVAGDLRSDIGALGDVRAVVLGGAVVSSGNGAQRARNSSTASTLRL
jgi:imidazolonepropionase-like amidohydrolase